MNDDGDYTWVDEMMYYVTLIVLFLMVVVFLAGVAGFIWAMI